MGVSLLFCAKEALELAGCVSDCIHEEGLKLHEQSQWGCVLIHTEWHTWDACVTYD